MRGRWHCPWCIADIGTVTYPCEKMEGCCMTVDMRAFLYYINLHPLADLQLAGASFMWSKHQNPPSLSRLDRFFMSGDQVDIYLEVCDVALPTPTSDHCPALLILDAKDGVSPLMGLR